MIFEASVSLFAGLGLFFIGIKGFSTNLSQLVGRNMRRWISGWTVSSSRSALLGFLAGALTQSTNAVTVILMSMASADLITLRKAKPILAWANVGTASLIFLATVDMHSIVYSMIGITGLCFYLNFDRSARWRPVVSVILSLGLLLLGISLMRTGSHDLRDIEQMQTLLSDSPAWPISTLLVAAILAFLFQSASTITVMAITMTTANLITFDQTTLAVYGSLLGSAANTFVMAANISGTPRQFAVFQAMIKCFGAGLFAADYLLEHILHYPALHSLVSLVTVQAGFQIGMVFLMCQLVTVFVQIILGEAFQPLVVFLSPSLPHENLSRPRYLYDQALADPETALTLVDREQARLFALLPLYLELREVTEEEDRLLSSSDTLAVAKNLHQYIDHFLKDIVDTGADRHVLEAASNRQAGGLLLLSMHETLAALGKQLTEDIESPSLSSLRSSLREGLGGLLLTSCDAVRSLDPADIALIRKLTSDRDSVIDQLRNSAISASQVLTPDDRRRLYACTSDFELLVWMLRRYMGTISAPAESRVRRASDLAIA